MISILEIQDRVREWGLREEVVEKDYVLGWILAAIGDHPRLSDTWVFKGGTCLKKCYFETFRFSEDLDFTVIDGGPEDPDELVAIFREIARRVYEESGIEIPPDQIRFEVHLNRRGGKSIEGRVYYRGPRQVHGSLPRVKLDITSDEVLACSPVRLPIGHSYADALPGGGTVLAYSHTEIFAEKIRALGERTRPRDLYDVIHLMGHPDGMPSAAELHEVLSTKCRFKGIAVPSMASLRNDEVRAELESDWENMLAHQLRDLPPLDWFWDQLPQLFEWLEGTKAPTQLPRIAVAATEDANWVPPRAASVWNERIPLESVRFAAANRLCVDLRYQGSWRVIEPYSLRRTKDGNLLLYAIKADTRDLRSYRVDRIEEVKVTQRGFTPTYVVELTATGPAPAPPMATRGHRVSVGLPARRSKRAGASSRKKHHGPTYVIACTACGKRFTRSQCKTSLNAHKDKRGGNCYGRIGYLVDTQWR